MKKSLVILFQFIFVFFLSSSMLAKSTFPVQKQLPGNGTFSIEVRDAEIKDVLRALAQQSGLNIIISEEVEGTVTFSFDNISIQDALEIILKAHNLGFVIHKNVVWVGEQEKLAKSGEGMVTEVVRLNYANSTDLVPQVKEALSPVGTVTADSRTNALIIKDLPMGIMEAKRLVETLDARTLQVVIEARIIEVSSNFSKELGVRWGGEYRSGGGNVITGVSALPESDGGRNFAVSLPAADITGGLGLVIGSLRSTLTLDLELTAGEREGKLKIISRPKITTLNNQPATIRSGLTFRVRTSETTTTTEGGGTTTSATLEEIETGVDLTVIPRITSDNHVLLNIVANKSDPDFSRTLDGIPGISEKSASTAVLVKDGETTVIGGLYRTSSSSKDDKVPYFSKIPLLSWLFKSHSEKLDNEELLIFITPHIVREN